MTIETILPVKLVFVAVCVLLSPIASLSCDRESRVQMPSKPIGPIEIPRPANHSTWSVSFTRGPHPTRLVYDADTLTCWQEGTLEDAFAAIAKSYKSLSDYNARRTYGAKQVEEWAAEAKKRGDYQWP